MLRKRYIDSREIEHGALGLDIDRLIVLYLSASTPQVLALLDHSFEELGVHPSRDIFS